MNDAVITRPVLQAITPHAHPRLSKSRIMAGLQCHKRLWLETYRRELMVYGDATNAAFAQGNEFGELARQLIAAVDGRSGEAGHLIAAVEDPAQALKDTAAALDAHRVLFEPAFRYDGVFVRVDGLIRHNHGDAEPSYTMVEVKAASSVKPQYIRDAAVQTWVLRGTGLNVTRIEIGHVNTDFTYNGFSYNGLLKREDITAQVEQALLQVDSWVLAQREMLRSAQAPDIAMGGQCRTPYPCPFIEHCTAATHSALNAPDAPVCPPSAEFPVMLLPGVKGKVLARKLRAQGFEDLLTIPAEKLEEFAFVQTVYRSGQAWHDAPAAHALLTAQPKPWGYLDFETISPAVPLWADTKPFAHWPFQWSVHVETPASSPTGLNYCHHEFLDLSGNNPTALCVESLLAALDGMSTVWAYNAAFERQAILRMAHVQPQHKAALTALADKLQDLIPIVQACYYHPAMQGSYSIKSVLPAIAPELNYHHLQGVQDGNAAQGAFFEAVNPNCTVERRAELDTQLRAYCALDTWAMVVLVERLLSPVK
jgi:Domain of unknown function(DUF2779)